MNCMKILPIYCYNDNDFVPNTTKKTTNPYNFHNKSDLDTQINTSDRLQKKKKKKKKIDHIFVVSKRFFSGVFVI